jgi:hypothetical protein
MNLLKSFINSVILQRYRDKTIGSVLKKSLHILDIQTVEEIKRRTRNLLSKDGGFCDRAGKPDIYYSLFGSFVSEALSEAECIENLKNYVKKLDLSKSYDNVNLYCAAILVSQFPDKNINTRILIKQVKDALLNKANQSDYNFFLGFLTLYYQKDYFLLYKILKQTTANGSNGDFPCPVLAARAIIIKISGRKVENIEQRIMSFYRENGSFCALKNSPVGDLLSTAVALYALQFIHADFRAIKPDCMAYVDSLYENGSFKATSLDEDTDIEYTFYGLLALGSLN